MAALVAVCGLTVLLIAVWGLVLARLPQRARQPVAGAIMGVVVLYVIVGFAYALWNAEPHPDGTDNCPGAPYTTC